MHDATARTTLGRVQTAAPEASPKPLQLAECFGTRLQQVSTGTASATKHNPGGTGLCKKLPSVGSDQTQQRLYKRIARHQSVVPIVWTKKARTHLAQIALGENKTDVSHQIVQEAQPLVVAGALAIQANASAQQGVLTHEDSRVGADGL